MEKRGEEKKGEEGDKLKIRHKDLLSMGCIGASLTNSVLTKRSAFNCPSHKSREWVQFGVFNKVNYISSKIFFNKVPHKIAFLGLSIKSTSKRVPADGWWFNIKKEIPKTLSHIETEG